VRSGALHHWRYPPSAVGMASLSGVWLGRRLYRFLKALAIPVELYAPFGTPHEELQPSFLDKAQEAATSGAPHDKNRTRMVAVVEILKRIEEEPFHWPIGRTTFQKDRLLCNRVRHSHRIEIPARKLRPICSGPQGAYHRTGEQRVLCAKRNWAKCSPFMSDKPSRRTKSLWTADNKLAANHRQSRRPLHANEHPASRSRRNGPLCGTGGKEPPRRTSH